MLPTLESQKHDRSRGESIAPPSIQASSEQENFPSRVRIVSLLLFVSGLCALVFQTAWLREFRLIFGATTPASAAVLAIFMGGLGLGNALLGKRADRTENPLRLYGQLELAISLAAALSPFLVQIIRGIYIGLGGQESLGSFGATIVRLVLSSLVLGLPTFLMGGTLAAAARAVTAPDDKSRGSIGWLYGLNTIGAVVGALLSTFFLLETLGNREALWTAAALNFGNACFAWWLSKTWQPLTVPASTAAAPSIAATKPARKKDLSTAAAPLNDLVTIPAVAPQLVYAAACAVGFAFFLMELVWYRMLGALLGGTTFTFGLILAVALAGIGIGGALYPLLYRNRPPTARDFALTCGWEALAIAFPFALGDHLAILALVLQDLRSFGFFGQIVSWTVIAGMVIFPAALVSGLQFPLLISLLGQGSRDVGQQVGRAFAWNTVGAMAGSLAGGFGLLPLLSAPGAWRLVVVLMAVLALVVLLTGYRRDRRAAALLHPLMVINAAALCLLALGPTAVWRHSGIGAGRASPEALTSGPNDLKKWMHDRRRNIAWQADGSEASVAIATRGGIAFLVNGKSDGNSITDAPTQIMFPVLGAILHSDPQESLVIGLGTGESAGWLASLPNVRSVDVAELEPVIAHVAEACAAHNHDVLNHPKVRIIYNDARELIQTTSRQYDLIASEPSNPYRAGVASLYTVDFYKHARQRLKPGGFFMQWVQGYEIDVPTVRMVLASLHQVFRHVEIWETKPGDMVLICAMEHPTYDLAQIKSRAELPEYRRALLAGWRTSTVEGVLAHFIASEEFATKVADLENAGINTDNRNLLEYSFARTVGQSMAFSVLAMRQEARSLGMHRPRTITGGVDWEALDDQVAAYNVVLAEAPLNAPIFPGDRNKRFEALNAIYFVDAAAGLVRWESQSKLPVDFTETAALAIAGAASGSSKANDWIPRVAEFNPTDAAVLSALLAFHQGRLADAAALLEQALVRLRTDASVLPRLVEYALRLPAQIVEKEPAHAKQLLAALSEPLAVYMLDERRLLARLAIAQRLGPVETAAAMQDLEPYVPWDGQVLDMRLRAYEATTHPFLSRARRELELFRRQAPEQTIFPP
jgi:spermidine synthase